MSNKITAKDKSHLEKLIKNQIALHGNQCDLNHIDTSLVTNMSQLFMNSNFNGNISGWDVTSVYDMTGMFANSKFNSDISSWDVSNVQYMDYMFYNAQFIGDISKWDTSKVEDMSYMFENHLGSLPYWVHYNDKEERKIAINNYKLNKQLEEKLDNHLNDNNQVTKIKL
jgi:surface protein